MLCSFPYHSGPPPQQTRDVDPVLFSCCASVEDAGPTLKQLWANVLRSLVHRATVTPGQAYHHFSIRLESFRRLSRRHQPQINRSIQFCMAASVI